MTTDERIDAIAMHLEVLTGMHADYEARNEARMQKLEGHLDRVITLVEKVTNMVGDHENRINKLEGQ